MKDHAFDYHFYASPAKIYTGYRDSSIQEMLQDYCAAMEETIRKYPLQWYNYFDFWEKE
jgi:predicted LPLAT superfamily acyltransferase